MPLVGSLSFGPDVGVEAIIVGVVRVISGRVGVVGSSGMGGGVSDGVGGDVGEAAGMLFKQTGQRETELEHYETTSRELSDFQKGRAVDEKIKQMKEMAAEQAVKMEVENIEAEERECEQVPKKGAKGHNDFIGFEKYHKNGDDMMAWYKLSYPKQIKWEEKAECDAEQHAVVEMMKHIVDL